jgi:hypothetical protein
VGFFTFRDNIRKQHRSTVEPRSFMATLNTDKTSKSHLRHQLPINVDLVAIALGLMLAALIRFGVIHQVSF